MAWGSFLIAAAALKTPTRNGYNAQGVNFKLAFGGGGRRVRVLTVGLFIISNLDEQALVCLSNRYIVDASRGCTFHCKMANIGFIPIFSLIVLA